MFKSIVVGYDGSELSEKALHCAIGIAKMTQGEVHVVHTPQPLTVAYAMGAVGGYPSVATMPSPHDLEVAKARINEAVQKIAKAEALDIGEVKITGPGDPGDEIVRYADLCDADLIVTGRRGLGAFGSMVQGSTSLRVNHLAKCASLSVA